MSKKKFRNPQRLNLSAKEEFAKTQAGHVLPYDLQAVYQTRIDIANWSQAVNLFNCEEPRSFALQLIFDKISNDALLTSQIENRKQSLFAAEFALKKTGGDIDEDSTLLLKNSSVWRQINNAILDSGYFGYSLIEFVRNSDGGLSVEVLPRTNIIPQIGTFYGNYVAQINPVKYRELPEYGTWILEFSGEKLGLLNKAVPHVLMKTFAQSCWSELCEIYGIPPRVMKTNTRDPRMLERSKRMMKDLGAAAWFIIDTTENFEWANPVLTKGEVYQELIRLCNNEMSLAISGAIVGQDTKNGSNSKEQTSQQLLETLINADITKVEQSWNDIVIPALVNIGYLPQGLRLEFQPAQDIEQLFNFTIGLMPYKDVDDDWIKDKFGVEVTGNRNAAPAMGFSAQNAKDFFF